MAKRLEPLIHHMRKLVRVSGEQRVSDGHLLGRFIATRDEAAFEALVRRHARMVYSVCLRLLGNAHDAEDAFQATFLVLTRKAGSLSAREAVGNWLYGVACRTAQGARVRNARRRCREQRVAHLVQPPTDEATWRQLVPVLDEVLVRLPDKYRLPIVLCELEGRPRKEVARQLGVPEGTLSSRLATGRKLLAKRLAKYGPSSGLLLATVLSGAAEASVSPTLVSSMVKTALGGSSAAVIALAQGVLKVMFISKLKTVSLLTALAVSMTIGAVGLTSAQQKASVEPNGVATPGKRTPALKDELDVLRLEIEAIRKDLKLTKDRVQTLEDELHRAHSRMPSAQPKSDGVATVEVLGQGAMAIKMIETESTSNGSILPGTQVNVVRMVRPVGRGKENELTYVQFRDSMVTNGKTNTTVFHGNVHILHLPCESPKMEIDLDALLDKLPKGAMYLSADQFEVFGRGPKGNADREMRVTGRCVLKAQEYWGWANRITYDEAKDQLILEGSEKEPAVLNTVKYQGVAPAAITAQRIIIFRKTGEHKADGIEASGGHK